MHLLLQYHPFTPIVEIAWKKDPNIGLKPFVNVEGNHYNQCSQVLIIQKLDPNAWLYLLDPEDSEHHCCMCY